MDIPGAFLHADMEEEVHMLLEGMIAELIVKLDPKLYRKKYIWRNKNNKHMLYVKLKNPSIGHYKRHCCFGDYCENRLGMLNEYNKCMANKTING